MTMLRWLTSAKQALTLLTDTEGVVPEVDNIPVTDLVALGQRLWWMTKRANKVLDAIKVRLRKEAHGHTGEDAWRCDSPEGGHCLVIRNESILNVRKDADIVGLRALLGDRFPEFFQEVVTYKPHKHFQIRTAGCMTDEQAVLLESVDLVDRTPRVVFKD